MGNSVPAQSQQQPAVIVQYVQMPSFGVQPVTLTCPHCQAHVRTRTESEPGPLAWILGGILCVVGLPFCACISCCIDSFNTVTHKCPQCKAFLGRDKGGMEGCVNMKNSRLKEAKWMKDRLPDETELPSLHADC